MILSETSMISCLYVEQEYDGFTIGLSINDIIFEGGGGKVAKSDRK